MNFQYCSSCGSKMEYMLHPPNFCPSCGIPLSGKKDAQKPTPSLRAQGTITPQMESEDPEGTNVSAVPQLNKLEYDLDIDYSVLGSRRVKLDDVIGSGDPKEEPEING